MWEPFRAAAAGMQSHPDFRLAQSALFSREREGACRRRGTKLAAHAPNAASDLRDADHRGLGETHETYPSGSAGRKARPAVKMFPHLAGQIEGGQGKETQGFVLSNTTTRRLGLASHSSEQILEAFEYGGVLQC